MSYGASQTTESAQMKVETPYEQLLFTTVRIQAEYQNGLQGTGTGFIFGYEKSENESYFFVVTNKHVIKDTTQGSLSFNRSDGQNPLFGNPFVMRYPDFGKLWTFHPNDEIDVAVLPFAHTLNQLSQMKVRIFFKSVSKNLIPDNAALDKIDAIEEVIFIGYPNDIFDKKNLLPVVRKGITATPIKIDFEGKPQFLIDASIFPGSSGSPVFLANMGSYSPRGQGLVFGSRVHLLGIVSSVFVRRDINKVELSDIPTANVPIVQTTQMIDLGLVYKSSTIRETVQHLLKSRGIPDV